MTELLRGAGYAPHVEILYGEQVVQLPVDDGSTAELERVHNDLLDLVPRVLKAAAAGHAASDDSAGDALRMWIVQEFNAKRELLHLHRPVSGYCGTCLAGDRESGQFPGPAVWPCRTVDEVIAPLREIAAL